MLNVKIIDFDENNKIYEYSATIHGEKLPEREQDQEIDWDKEWCKYFYEEYGIVTPNTYKYGFIK